MTRHEGWQRQLSPSSLRAQDVTSTAPFPLLVGP